MVYLISKFFPYVWPYIKEIVAGWVKHPYFTRNGYRMAMKKFGILFLFVSFLVIGSEYVATLRELEIIKKELDAIPPAYVSFEDVKNYHELFNSPETRRSLEECKDNSKDLSNSLVEKTHQLQLEKILHAKTLRDLEELRKSKFAPPQKPTKSDKDALNDRLNPKKDR